MSQILLGILIFYAILSLGTLIAFIGAVLQEDELKAIFKSPKEIYNNIRVNWFGAVSIFILLTMVCPLGYIFYAIPKFLFTMGRK